MLNNPKSRISNSGLRIAENCLPVKKESRNQGATSFHLGKEKETLTD